MFFLWHWVRFFSPFINTYAFVFLVGGAIVSAIRFWRQAGSPHRVLGNALIAVGAILPGIGGTATRFGHTEVLYVTEEERPPAPVRRTKKRTAAPPAMPLFSRVDG